ncbi:hypothetical protein [Aquamicrobium defluvii]|uniref:DUF680 domain-containing protein n=1 Tax=Aquamicrobium defluvii TaxID=69279 RepID=A0A011TZR6_9HYPH|nr:hypothetical protein [Aquamicrobium defluvii]EXL09622.1 hypothetical protein BG36_21210 [Aquamicrobium defluvii]EZQ16344.1 hypothetical protein CF98_40515 [Halopseudomonas bauzanensis]TDR36890.1 hypothetical protein DES43_104216 [Aquamicrobium defluvii]
MKTAIVALAALLALSGAGVAAPQLAQNSPATCIAVDQTTGKKVKVDCASTGSISKNAGEGKTAGPRLGIDVNPFVPGL